MTSDRPSLAKNLDVYGLTHCGLVRQTNEDHFLVCSVQKIMQVHNTSLPDSPLLTHSERLAFLALVADGVGGTNAGEEASRIALEHVTRYVEKSLQTYYAGDPDDDDAFMHELEDAALKVHAEIAAEGEGDHARRGMATTLTLWLGVGFNAYLLQVGDSRCYILRHGELIQISRDQTMAEEFVDHGVFSRTDAAYKRWSNVLSSAIGGAQAAPIVTRVTQSMGSVGLMCSDGLTRHVSDERIRERLLTMTSSRATCEALLQDALDAGGEDNITIIIGRPANSQEQNGAAIAQRR
jgi:serine/threonine protein phosphatase PrpC